MREAVPRHAAQREREPPQLRARRRVRDAAVERAAVAVGAAVDDGDGARAGPAAAPAVAAEGPAAARDDEEHGVAAAVRGRPAGGRDERLALAERLAVAVSYTHLTLPTILLV